jgi:hypothetical protein
MFQLIQCSSLQALKSEILPVIWIYILPKETRKKRSSLIFKDSFGLCVVKTEV